MKWFKGKYNGRYIQGFRIIIVINLFDWSFIPVFDWFFGQTIIKFLCFKLEFETEYYYKFDPDS